jgi:hypothetical protein
MILCLGISFRFPIFLVPGGNTVMMITRTRSWYPRDNENGWWSCQNISWYSSTEHESWCHRSARNDANISSYSAFVDFNSSSDSVGVYLVPLRRGFCYLFLFFVLGVPVPHLLWESSMNASWALVQKFEHDIEGVCFALFGNHSQQLWMGEILPHAFRHAFSSSSRSIDIVGVQYKSRTAGESN